ncbi:S8 family serine peptidase [Nocardioides hwasunensis]|uniref:S8 family serine peptidase n=1 Tax=Nocardioides hwasunensis TaxID=397258 RepID=A0ABR8MHM2_9ACTN|nr:S8 family serine peptidase [Nocardioides hwasunensis]MBD3915545.1 S8 family serine peptidase [Nocardioides hwasunensis]
MTRLRPRVRRAAGWVALLPLTLVCTAALAGAVAVPAAAEPGGCEVKPGADAPGVVPWAQERLGFDRVHRFATGAGVTVAVIDSGLTQVQPQAALIRTRTPLNVMGGPYAADDTYDCEDYGHGTRVAAIIGAPAMTGEGFMGLAPEATIMPIKYRDSDTSDIGGDSAAVARGIIAAVEGGADVINLSLQAPDTPELRTAMERAAAADVVVVASSGNLSGSDLPEAYPGKYAEEEGFGNVITVGATDQDDQLTAFSVSGTQVGIVAPGAQILGPTQIQGYYAEDGTSFSTPFVAATAALVRQTHPRLSAARVVNRLKATADPPGVSVPDAGYGYGIVDPYLAVTAERDDRRITAPQQPLPAAPAPDLPPPPDHTLRDAGMVAAAALLGLALVVLVATIAVRHVRERGAPRARSAPLAD